MRQKTKQALQRHTAVIVIFAISSVVMFMIAGNDLRYEKTTQSAGKVLEKTEADNTQEPQKLATLETTTNIEGSNNNNSSVLSASTNNFQVYSSGLSKIDIFNKNISDLESYLSDNKLKDQYCIIFKDLAVAEISYELNSNSTIPAANFYNTALALVILDQADKNKLSLEDQIYYGTELKTIDEIIYLLIAENSDNAVSALENKLGGYSQAQKLLKNDLGISIKRIENQTTTQDVSKLLETLYSSNKGAYIMELVQETQTNTDYAFTKSGDYILLVISKKTSTSSENSLEIDTIIDILLENLN
jgi:hypothetical protein